MWLVHLLILFSIFLLAIVLLNPNEYMVLSYVTYLLSTYTLVIAMIRLPQGFRSARPRVIDSEKVKRQPILRRFLTDLSFRGTVSIYLCFMLVCGPPISQAVPLK